MQSLTVVAVAIEWAGLVACTGLVVVGQRWVAGASVLWLAAIASASLQVASDDPVAPGTHPLIVGLFGWPFALCFGGMELVILSFVSPNRFDDRSPARRLRAPRNTV